MNLFVYDGKTIHGSNMKDLPQDILTNRVNTKSPLFAITTFTKALADVNTPTCRVDSK